MSPRWMDKKRLGLGIGLVMVTTLAGCAVDELFWSQTIDFDMTGRVIDADTKAPIEGAYAMAVYEKVEISVAGSGRNCVRTKGMVTGKDGQFNFPISKGNGEYLTYAVAIKPDYYLQNRGRPDEKHWPKLRKETYSNWNVQLKKQDAAKPSFKHGFSDCERPESSADIEAAVRFMKIKVAECLKHGGVACENTTRLIESMQRTVVSQMYKKKP